MSNVTRALVRSKPTSDSGKRQKHLTDFWKATKNKNLHKKKITSIASERSSSAKSDFNKTTQQQEAKGRHTENVEDNQQIATGKKVTIQVWHGPKCPSCAAIMNIKEENMKRLQHHFKYCSCYSVYYRTMSLLESLILSYPIIGFKKKQKEPHFLNHSQAKQLCELSALHPTVSADNSELFQKAAELASQLKEPTDTESFNCDRYEEYMRLLLEITEFIRQTMSQHLNNGKNVEDVKILITNITNYLKPFDQNQDKSTSVTKSRSTTAKTRKWNETFADLRHPSGDNDFGNELKEIAEPQSGEECFLFPDKYTCKCHGQSADNSSDDSSISLSTF